MSCLSNKCNSCKKPYKVTDLKSTHVPLILPCADTLCESCIRISVASIGMVECPSCQDTTVVDSTAGKNFRAIREIFPLSTRTIAEIKAGDFQESVSESSIKFVYSKKSVPVVSTAASSISASKGVTDADEFCEECNKYRACCRCQECNVVLCARCFPKVHQVSNVLQRHVRLPLNIVATPRPKQVRQVGNVLQRHDETPCPNQPENAVSILDDLCLKANKKLSCIEGSLKRLLDTNYMNMTKTAALANHHAIWTELQPYFTKLHDELQLIENGLLLRIKESEKCFDEGVDKSIKELQQLHMVVESLAKQSWFYKSSRHSKNIDVHNIIKKFEECLNMPDTVVIKNPDVQIKPLNLDFSFMKEAKSQFDIDFGEPGFVSLEKFESEEDGNIASAVSTSKESPVVDSNINKLLSRIYPTTNLSSSSDSVTDDKLSKTDGMDEDTSFIDSCSSVTTESKDDTSESVAVNLYEISASILKSQVEQISAEIHTNHLKESAPISENVLGKQVNVVLKHVVSPSNFNVMLESSQKILEDYTNYFEKVEVAPRVTSEEIVLGEKKYVAKLNNGKWNRVRVLEINKAQRNEIMLKVKLIDDGSHETLPLSNLRHINDINAEMETDVDMAIACNLYDCLPVSRCWKEYDNERFIQFATSAIKFLQMRIIKIKKSSLSVDLLANKGAHEILSIRDLMCKSAMQNSTRSIGTKIVSLPEATSSFKYLVDLDFEKGDCVNVEILHVQSLNCFFAQKVDNKHLYTKMMDQLNKFYRIARNRRENAANSFEPGSAVVAPYSEDNRWYRAEIINNYTDVLKHQVTVRFVDYGNISAVDRSKVLKLPNEFKRYSIQVLRCSLAEVIPKTDKTWSKEAIKYFVDLARNVCFKMVVQNIIKPYKALNVLLYRSDETEDMCINAMFVEKGFAESIGSNTKIVTYSKNIVSQTKSAVSDVTDQKESHKKGTTINESTSSNKKGTTINDSTSTTINESTSSNKKGTKTNKSTSRNKRKTTTNELTSSNKRASTITESTSSSSIPDVESVYGSSVPSSVDRIKARIASCLNPGLIYLSLPRQLNTLQSLKKKLHKFYNVAKNNKNLEMEAITDRQKCVVYLEGEESWFRGIVLEKLSNRKVKVFLKDIARIVDVDINNLRTILPKFDRIRDAVSRCHLAGLDPDNNNWSDEICNRLKQTLAKYSEIYVSRKGDVVSDTSVPVIFWGKKVVIVGALEPDRVMWININEELTRAGVLNVNVTDAESYEESTLDDVLHTLDSEGISKNIQEWLEKSVDKTNEDDDNTTFSELLENNDDAQSDISNKTCSSIEKPFQNLYRLDWLPAEPIKKKNFMGTATHVDYDLSIYVQVDGQTNSILDVIEIGLMKVFKDSTPLPVEQYWTAGQICIALYYLDNKWYRAKVLEVISEQKLKVEFVDYGNVEFCEPSSLRKNIVLLDIPIQCHRLPIRSDCIPNSFDGKWPIKVIEFVHQTVVEKFCSITLTDDFEIKELTLSDEIELFSLLKMLDFARIKPINAENKSSVRKSPLPNNKIVSSDSDTESDIDEVVGPVEKDFVIDDVLVTNTHVPYETIKSEENLVMKTVAITDDCYKELDGDHEDASFLMFPQLIANNEKILPNVNNIAKLKNATVEVTRKLADDEIVVQILESDDGVIKKYIQAFEFLTEVIVDADSQPPLEAPFIGRVCCGPRANGNGWIWLRCQILGFVKQSRTMVYVLYVDKGIVELAVLSSLRKLKQEWFEIPIQCIRCIISDLPNGPINAESEEKNIFALIGNTYKADINVIDETKKLFSIVLRNNGGDSPLLS